MFKQMITYFKEKSIERRLEKEINTLKEEGKEAWKRLQELHGEGYIPSEQEYQTAKAILSGKQEGCKECLVPVNDQGHILAHECDNCAYCGTDR